jgi:catechol 2,3-dioxygenase
VAIDPATTLGAVRLDVADLDALRGFYERVVGLRTLEGSDGVARLGSDDGAPLITLAGRPDAPARPPGTTGLFHLAILVPTRRDLALALQRVAGNGWRLTGASDHLVSEALYLSDLEGNGIEIYRDRPREEWSYDGGSVQMATLPLDLEDLVAELREDSADADGVPPGTRIGHVHLQVADLAAAEAFYSGVVGFEVTVRSYPGALFVSAGGYHHHVGLNTWAGEGAPSPPPGSRGLRWFEVIVPSQAELQAIAGRADGAGMDAQRQNGGLLLSDPSGNGVALRTPTRT